MKGYFAMNRSHLVIITFCVVTAFISQNVFADPERIDMKLGVEEFGTFIGETVDEGFVFIDGQYIDSPYIVVRKELAIFINDRMIAHPIRWENQTSSLGVVDPKLPSEINKETSLFDEAFREYIRHKIAYIQKNYTRDDERQKMQEVYTKLPFVKEAKIDQKDHDLLHIKTFKEDVDTIRLTVPRRKSLFNKEDLLKQSNAQRKNYEKRLRKGDCYFFFSGGGHITAGSAWVTEKLPGVVKILRSTKSHTAKINELEKEGLPINTEPFSDIVTNFVATPQLENRLNRLINN
jgi:hypothetical protein